MKPSPLADAAVMAASILFALGYAYWLHGRREVPVKLGALFSLCLEPSVAFMHMWAHLFAVGAVNLQRYFAGGFSYNLGFYALLLIGVVFLMLSGYCLHALRLWVSSGLEVRRALVGVALLQMALSFPLLPFTPIGALPGLAGIVLLLALAAVRRPFRVVRQSQSLALHAVVG
jgi:hypothetical protein